MTKAERQKVEETYLKSRSDYDEIIKHLSKLVVIHKTKYLELSKELEYYKSKCK